LSQPIRPGHPGRHRNTASPAWEIFLVSGAILFAVYRSSKSRAGLQEDLFSFRTRNNANAMDINLTSTQGPPPLVLQPAKTSYRIDSIDLLRGLVMIIMALDHTRDYFHVHGMDGNPLNLQTTTPLLYFTRWITHFCAPTFVFLAGAGAYFQSLRKSKKELSGFLISRGLWLLLIEIFVMSFAFSFDIYFSIIALQTIWAIGISMIFLGLAIWLPFNAILVIGAVIVLGHNALDFKEINFNSQPGWLYSMFHQVGFYKLWDGHNLLILYPFIPWAGLMMLGYCFGKLYLKFEGWERKKILIILGLGIILFFVILRWWDVYGNPRHMGFGGKWSTQKDGLFTFLSFMDVAKYPPSLLFMCATIGPAILFLAFTGHVKNWFTKFITVYGRVPFFFYILHFFWIHILSAIFFFARGHSWSEGVHENVEGFLPNFVNAGEGYSLGIVYLMWIFVVVSLYPLCKWFSEYKQRHRDKWWLSYL
jgi:uncharacterized membrane protein